MRKHNMHKFLDYIRHLCKWLVTSAETYATEINGIDRSSLIAISKWGHSKSDEALSVIVKRWGVMGNNM